jgi:hypothetical protein
MTPQCLRDSEPASHRRLSPKLPMPPSHLLCCTSRMSPPLSQLSLGRRALFVVSCVLLGIAVSVVAYTCIGFLFQINSRVGADTPWFVIPALALTWGTLVLTDRACQPRPSSHSASTWFTHLQTWESGWLCCFCTLRSAALQGTAPRRDSAIDVESIFWSSRS